ncbi:MAG: PKD domain-containing protein [Nocardioides sp.]
MPGFDEVAAAAVGASVRTPVSVVTPDLRTVALWVDYPRIRGAVRPRGGTFGEPFELDAGNFSYVPQWLDAVALPDGEVLAVWSSPGYDEMRIKSLQPDGTISDARPAEVGGAYPVIAANDAGMVAVAYFNFNQLTLVIRPAGADSFEPPITLLTLVGNEVLGTFGSERQSPLDITVRDDGQVAVALGTAVTNPNGGTARMLIARRAGGTTTVETVDYRALTLTPAPGTTNAAEFRGQIELLPDGRQLLVYRLQTFTNDSLSRELRGGPRDGTSAPSPPQIVPTTFGSQGPKEEHSLILDDTGRPWLWWRQGTATGDELRVQQATATGAFSSPAQTVASPFDTAVSSALGAGRIGLLFSQAGKVEASTSMDGSAFGPPVDVAMPGQMPPALGGGTLALAGGGEGSAVALWPVGATVQTAGLRATTFDATPPSLQSIQAPASLTAGVAGTFTASAVDDWSVPVVSWIFSDGVGLTGSTVQRAFPSAGTYTATARVTDAVGHTATDTRTVTVTAAPVVVPVAVSNSFQIGKLKLNKIKGTAKMPITVPGPGTLVITGRGVVKQMYSPRTAGTFRVLVKSKGKKAATLKAAGKVRLKVTLTYTPTGGLANAKIRRVVLKKYVD